MTRGYNELVGLQATFDLKEEQYTLTHIYRWSNDDETETTGTMRGYNMRRYIPIVDLVQGLRDVYTPVIKSIWRQVTDAYVMEYLQFHVCASPGALGLPGNWDHWAQM